MDCRSEWSAAAEVCGGNDDPDAVLACLQEVDETLGVCLTECGASADEVCRTGCGIAYERAVELCQEAMDVAAGPNGAGDDGLGDWIEECWQRAEIQLWQCELDCDGDTAGEFRCASDCEVRLQLALLDCGDDGECHQNAQADYAGCLEQCGIEVPDIREPDPCLSECERAQQRTVEECFARLEDAAAIGVVDPGAEECFSAGDRAYWTCLEDCGIDFPEPPDIPEDDPCVAGCDESYDAAFRGCFDPNTGAVDEECVAAADLAYVECLGGCGVDIPDGPNLPGPAGDSCAGECDGALLNGLFACFDPDTGDLDVTCVVGIVTDYELCREGCEDDEETGALAAMLRGARDSAGSFIRGDANRDSALNLADAVWILNELFSGGAPTTCQDAADANDDGSVNVSDPVSLLNHLFNGAPALPMPSEVPGDDPTADALGCAL